MKTKPAPRQRRRAKDWLLIMATVAAWAAVCGAYMGRVWPHGQGALVAFVSGVIVLFVMLIGGFRWSDG